ncbi:unnamed protein product, partial [Symbiodinium microadriaticum]
MGPPPPNVTAPYGWPENRPIQTAETGTRYFWGIATVDIDMSVLDFSCDPGKEFSSEVGDCVTCEGWRAYTNSSGMC